MSIKETLKKRAVSGFLAISLVTSLMTAYVVAEVTVKPTVHIDGLELRVRAEYKTDQYGRYEKDAGGNLIPVIDTKTGRQAQSIQALVSVSISDMGSEYCTGVDIPLAYNETYLTPSNWVSNGAITENVNDSSDASAVIDNEDLLHHLFFRTDEALYGGEDPFDMKQTTAGGYPNILSADVKSNHYVKLQLEIRRDLTIKDNSAIAEKTVTNGWTDKTYRDTYIKVDAGKQVTLGTFSFRVNNTIAGDGVDIDKLQESLNTLATKYNGGIEGRPKDTSDSSKALFGIYEEANEKLELHILFVHPTSGINRISRSNDIQCTVHVDSDDVIVKVAPVPSERTISSYEAYTNGQVSDLALAMQKYAESIRVTYASGAQSDHAIYWGDPTTCTNMPKDGPGMFIRKKTGIDDGKDVYGDIYRFTWTSTGYTFEKLDGTTKEVVFDGDTALSDFAYDPRGNQTYLMSQYFTYTELEGAPPESGEDKRVAVLKAYPTPVEVKLTVTPIRVTGASVDHKTVTYQNAVYNKDTAPDGVPEHYSALDLATDAKLALDTGLNGVVPTVPVTWAPASLTTTTTVDSETKTVGIDGVDGSGVSGGKPVWPLVKTDYEEKTGIGTYEFTATVDDSDISRLYPWLTTNGDYNFTSYRRIVDTDVSNTSPELASRYELTVEPYEDNRGDVVGKLRVTIAKRTADGKGYEDMPDGSTFRLYMPDGTEVSTGWFDANGASYASSRLSITGTAGGKNVYQIQVSPGNLGASGTYQTQLETLRRYINLGGWFGLQVHEGTKADEVWSDMLTDYSQPRTNVYIESHTLSDKAAVTDSEKLLFNYSGNNSGLMPFYTGSSLPTFVTLPADDSVAVRYDAFSGEQPGHLRQFAVEKWGHIATSDKVTTYGADLFARTYPYSDNGLIVNPDTGAYAGYRHEVKDRKVTVMVEAQTKPASAEPKLRLTYEQSGDSVTLTSDGEVDRVTFNTKQVGYTYQQVVTLTLTNEGTTDIRGLHIDVPTTAYTSGVAGPYFDIISAPAVNLPAGASTTFQVSYVPNLPVGTYQNITETRRIYIYDENGGPAKEGSQLKTFEAVIKVIEGKLHAVTLVVHPGEMEDVARVMGDASLVAGVSGGVYDSTAAPTTYEEGGVFWVLTEPLDEYKLLTRTEDSKSRVQVYYEDENGDKVYLTESTGSGVGVVNGGMGFVGGSTTDAGRGIARLFWGAMPDRSIKVHVHYYEDLYSKLRITDLHAYAWDNALKDDSEKGWTKEEVPPDGTDNRASVWTEDYEKPLRESQGDDYAVVDGKTVKFDPEKDEYIVVLNKQGDGDDWCGVEITLRDVKIRVNGVGDWTSSDPKEYYAGTNTYLPATGGESDPRLSVVMRVDDGGEGTAVGGNPPFGETNGGTDHDEASVHKSISFEAPVDSAGSYMASRTVTITVAYTGADLNPEEGLITRSYKVRFVRRVDQAKHVARAGNSPYGMIMNDKDIADKALAKTAYDKENRFATGYVPLKAAELTGIYWPEAWGSGTNYDKDDTALFVYLGQDFDEPGVEGIYNNAGDLIPDDTVVTLTLEEYYIMKSASSAYGRFDVSAKTKTPIPLGTAKSKDGAIQGQRIPFSTAEYTIGEDSTIKAVDIRPGIYALTYTFQDYDSTETKATTLSFTRPLIVLAPRGDVDASWGATKDSLRVTNADASAIWSRFGATKLPVKLPDGTYSAPDKLLYQYRIVDANNDRNINEVDADMIRRAVKTSTNMVEFYRPMDYTNLPATP